MLQGKYSTSSFAALSRYLPLGVLWFTYHHEALGISRGQNMSTPKIDETNLMGRSGEILGPSFDSLGAAFCHKREYSRSFAADHTRCSPRL